MKPHFEEIRSRKGNSSVLAYRLQTHRFPFKWHYHPEFELTVITRGHGDRLIGDSLQSFEDGDLVLIPPNLPHTWVTSGRPRYRQTAVVVQFPDSVLESFAGFSELQRIHNLLLHARRGLVFQQRYSEQVRSLLTRLPDTSGATRIALFIDILAQLSHLPSKPAAGASYVPVNGTQSEQRINKVCHYLERHALDDRLELAAVAELIHLSESAFCKFFKRTTGKTFSDYVNDVRISHARRMLLETDKPVALIAAACGFRSITYFNRVFRKKENATPAHFRRHHPGVNRVP